VTSARCQVTLCNLIWHVSSRSGEAMHNCYTRLPLPLHLGLPIPMQIEQNANVSEMGDLSINAVLFIGYRPNRRVDLHRSMSIWFGYFHYSRLCSWVKAGPKNPFCVPTDELLRAKDDLLSEGGQSLNSIFADCSSW